MIFEVSSSTGSCESSTVDDSRVADGSWSIPGLGGTGCAASVDDDSRPFIVYHEFVVACSVVGDCFRYQDVLNPVNRCCSKECLRDRSGCSPKRSSARVESVIIPESTQASDNGAHRLPWRDSLLPHLPSRNARRGVTHYCCIC